MRANAGGAGLAVALALLGFLLIVMAARGTYYGVWHALAANPQDFATLQKAIATNKSTSPQQSAANVGAGFKHWLTGGKQ